MVRRRRADCKNRATASGPARVHAAMYVVVAHGLTLQHRSTEFARTDMTTIDDARASAGTLPRSYEALVRHEVRFRVGRMVYAAFYGDDTIMGFSRDEREALVASEPDKFLMP